MDLSFPDVSDSLGQRIGEFLTSQFEVPDHIQQILDLQFAGNTVMAYAFLLGAVLIGWVVSFMVSFLVGRVVRLAFGRLSPKFAKGVSRAIAGPIRISVLCWVALQGTVFLVKPPVAMEPVVVMEEAAVPGIGVTVVEAVEVSPDGAEPVVEVAETAPAQFLDRIQWRPHWTYLTLRAFFQVSLILSLFWIVARLMRFFWKGYLEPWIETSVNGIEKRYFGLMFRLAMLALWLWAILSSIAALGFDSRDEIRQVLGFSAASNTIGAYFSFLGLVLIALLLGRTLFNVLTRVVEKVVTKYGEETVDLEKTWFSGLERPVIYLITLIGFRIAATATLTPSESFPDIHGIIFMGLNVCMTITLTWITFILIDKFFRHILQPLTVGNAVIDEQLLMLARKTAKIGVGLISFIFMIKSLGQDPGTVIAGLGIGGLAVSFAAKDTLSNFMAGLTLYASKPFRMADFIIVEGDEAEGLVEEIGLRATIVRKRDGTKLIIPNEKLTSAVVENRTVKGKTKESILFSIDIVTTPQKRDEAIQLFVKTVHDVEGAADPQVDFLRYEEDSLELLLSYWVELPEKLNAIRTQILLLVDTRLRDIGVEIAIPTMSHVFGGYLHNGDAPEAKAVLEAVGRERAKPRLPVIPERD